MSLVDDGTERIVPETDPSEHDGSNGLVMSAIQWSVNSIYECQNREQLTKYYHSSLGSHVKSTLQSAARAGYLQGCPGFDLDAINKHIAVEDATEMGHMTKTPAGVRSTTTASNRGKTAKQTHHLERLEAADESQSLPAQEPGNKKTRKVFMTVQLADGYIASDQTGAYPRTSHRGQRLQIHLCILHL